MSTLWIVGSRFNQSFMVPASSEAMSMGRSPPKSALLGSWERGKCGRNYLVKIDSSIYINQEKHKLNLHNMKISMCRDIYINM